ncbi:MAG: hypothetical protein WC683_02570 [bacterium]
MQQGKLRRSLDLRLVSYAIAVLEENKESREVAVTAQACATATMMIAGGTVALIQMCKTAVQSPALKQNMGPDKFRKFEVLFEALGSSIEESWRTSLRELLELLIVFACELADGEEAHSLHMRAQSLGLDTSPLVVHEDDDEDIVEPSDAPRKRDTKPRARTPRSSYQQDRLEGLVRECIAQGIPATKCKLSDGRVEVTGKHPTHGEVHLRWLRGSMGEGETLCTKINDEIRHFSASDPNAEHSGV